MTTSFPFLKIARDTGYPYAEILRLAEHLSNEEVPDYGLLLHPAAGIVAMACLQEDDRRKAAAPNTVQWSAPRDVTSWKPDPSVGAAIGRPARWPHED